MVILQRWVNVEEDPEIVAAEDIRVLEEIRAEFDNSASIAFQVPVSSSNASAYVYVRMRACPGGILYSIKS